MRSLPPLSARPARVLCLRTGWAALYDKRARFPWKRHALGNTLSDGWPPMASVGTDRSGLTDYQSDDFSQDLIAGAVVGMVTVLKPLPMPT